MHVNWTLQRNTKIKDDEVKKLAKQLVPEIALMDELFDELSAFNSLLKF